MSGVEIGGMVLALLLGVMFGAALVIRGGLLILKRLGWKLFVINDDGKDNDGDDDDNEHEGDGPRDGATDGPSVMSGRCRGCGLFHVGLVPAVVELAGPGQFHIPGGSPAVCPRCWCKMNPDKLTNTVPMQSEAPPTPMTAPLKNPSGPVPADPPEWDGTIETVKKLPDAKPYEMDFKNPVDPTTGLSDEQLDALTKPDADAPTTKEAPVCCAQCGGKDGPFRQLAPGGKPSGKFWCQACVDQLGGPGPKKPKRRDRGEK